MKSPRFVVAVWIAGAAFAAACGGGDAAAPTSPISSATATPTAPCAVSPGGTDPVPAAASWNWEPVNIPNLQVESVFVDPEDEHVLFAGGTSGLYTTQDGGASWRVPVTGFVNSNAVAFLPASSCTAFAGGLPGPLPHRRSRPHLEGRAHVPGLHPLDPRRS